MKREKRRWKEGVDYNKLLVSPGWQPSGTTSHSFGGMALHYLYDHFMVKEEETDPLSDRLR